ncbi:MAG: aldolase [Comamonadaceae bacterium]|nr:MAG: aldolase [Comamonadaceae bacterium]
MNEIQAREGICRIGRSLFGRGYVHATAGNISVRLDDGFLITPTDACLGFLDPAQLSRMDLQGRQTGGAPASKTLALHRRIYEAHATLGNVPRCVIHTHSTHCVALTLAEPAGELLPPVTPYFVMKVGHVPVVPYHRPGAPEVASLVADLIARYAAQGTRLRAVMLSRLGPNVWHDSPAQAMAVLEELEETAKLWLLARETPQPLSAQALKDLEQAFGCRW